LYIPNSPVGKGGHIFMEEGSASTEQVRVLIQKRGSDVESLIAILQDIQQEIGYVPEEAVDIVARELEISPTRVYGILTFYAQFRLFPPGKHSLKVCQGTACHVMGGELILNYLMDKLDVKAGDTTSDKCFTFERVACVGCCGMAPVVLLDDKPRGNITITSVDKLINESEEGEE
jgi:NADH-quinone oxidoreductase subunit E